jgi:hypothetical protein
VNSGAAATYKCSLKGNAPKIIPLIVYLRIDAADHKVTYFDTLDAKSTDLPIVIDAWVRQPGVRMEWSLRRTFETYGEQTVIYTGYFDFKRKKFRMNGSNATGLLYQLANEPAGRGKCEPHKGKFPSK